MKNEMNSKRKSPSSLNSKEKRRSLDGSSPHKRSKIDSKDSFHKPKTSSKGGSQSSKKGVNSGTAVKKNVQAPANPQHARKNADIVNRGKQIWNELRCKTKTKEQIRTLMDELMPLISTKIVELTMQHDASRIVQAALQFGNQEERQQIVRELCTKNISGDLKHANSFLDICQSQYAHFVILKAFKYCYTDPVCVALLVQSFKGIMNKLVTHTIAGRVVEAIFHSNSLSRKDTAILKQEFYGPHFALFAQDTLRQLAENQQSKDRGSSGSAVTPGVNTIVVVPTLSANIALFPDKKDSTIEHIRSLIYKGMEKQLYGYTYFHELLLEYMNFHLEEKKLDVIRDTITSTNIADHILHLLSSKVGTEVVTLLIAYGTVKDRKRMIKCMKGYARSSLLHKDAYLAILRFIQLIDDTVAVQKNLLNELLTASLPPASTLSISKSKDIDNQKSEDTEKVSPLLEIAFSNTASKLLLMLLINKKTNLESYQKMLNPYEHEVLFPNPCILEKQADSSMLEVPTSKKDDEVRRVELLKSFHEPLLHLCCSHTEELLSSIPGSNVLYHMYVATATMPSAPPMHDLIQSICTVCKASFAGDATNMIEHVVAHRIIKNLILVDAQLVDEQSYATTGDAVESFANSFLKEVVIPHTEAMLQSNRGAFIVAALFKVTGLQPILKQHLEALSIKKLQKKAQKENQTTAGFDALLAELEKGGTGKKDKSKR
jgi:pumilio homology domain family member 6